MYNMDVSKIILNLLDEYGIVNVGGEPQTMYEFVKEYNPDIGKISTSDLPSDSEITKKDTSMCIKKMKGLL